MVMIMVIHHLHVIFATRCVRWGISSLLLYSRSLTSFLCVSIHFCPQLPVWLQQLPSSFAKSCSIWILLLPLVGLPLIRPSIISCRSPSCLKTWPIRECFLCQTKFSICPVFVYSRETDWRYWADIWRCYHQPQQKSAALLIFVLWKIISIMFCGEFY